MDATTTLLILVLSHHGYWFGGQPQTIDVQWAIKDQRVAAELTWALVADGATLATGKADVPADGERATRIDVTPPKVRARTKLTWRYELRQRDGSGDVLARASIPIELFADNLLDGLAARLGERRLVVIDPGGVITATLDGARVPHTRAAHTSALQVGGADVVLVAPDALPASDIGQGPLLQQARGGAGVMLFEQSAPRQLGRYALADRKGSDGLQWRKNHPLLCGLARDDWRTLLDDGKQTRRAIQLPADEAALETVYWPSEVGPRKPPLPRPIDALLVTQAAGAGRIVYCQLPAIDFQRDPRSQLLLVNAIDYLLTRPEPTPRPSERPDREAPLPASVPTILIPSGD